MHHSSPINVKRNILTSTFIPHPLLSQQAFSRFVQDYLVFGNAYLEKRTNRRGVDLDTYWFVQYGLTTEPDEFTKDSIFHLMEPDLNQEDVNNIRQAMKNAKGPGNFRNLFMYSPNGKKDGIQIIPLSEVAAKDEFLNIKNVSRDDMMVAHLVPPQMMGIMPGNVGGFGDVEKASRGFVRNELMPLQRRFGELNEWLGEEVIRFGLYSFL